jgi:hypothetical protein
MTITLCFLTLFLIPKFLLDADCAARITLHVRMSRIYVQFERVSETHEKVFLYILSYNVKFYHNEV